MGFQTYFKKATGEIYSRPIMFRIEFKVPWIFCWSFKIHQELEKPLPMLLVREFKIKWWAGFNLDLCDQENVIKFLETREKLKCLVQFIKFQKKAVHARLKRRTRHQNQKWQQMNFYSKRWCRIPRYYKNTWAFYKINKRRRMSQQDPHRIPLLIVW